MFLKIAGILIGLFYIREAMSANVFGQTKDGVGVSIFLHSNAVTETGFKANIYNMIFSHIWFRNDQFMADSYYNILSISASTSLVTSPNFSMTILSEANVYGITNQNMAGILIELTGYYHGT